MAKAKTTKTKEDQEVLMLTQQGYDKLVEELEHRKTVLRDEIASEIKQARDLGDLSENQAYADAMERKEMNEARIESLEYMISIAQVVSASTNDKIVNIGHTIEIQKVGGPKKTVTLVGKESTQEGNPAIGKISVDSPVGKALNMAQVGDTVNVKSPAGEVKYKILRILPDAA
jgi:transcription elongation factor GreA